MSVRADRLGSNKKEVAGADALLCTVGTSMFAAMPGLRELSADVAARKLENLPNPAQGGAEHQTLYLLTRRPELLTPRVLHLFHSDTEGGEAAARILARRFERVFTRVDWTRCRDLRDDKPALFATRGLRSLVNELVRAIDRLRRHGYSPAVDATGGYKPQIAYAALVGQIMQVPVYYRYAAFDHVIRLQPLPVSVDVKVWFDHLWFFDRLRYDVLPDRELPAGDRRIAPLLEREDKLVMLSPLGELMAAAVDQALAREGDALAPPPAGIAPERKKISYEDGNAGKHRGLEDFCRTLVQVPFVTRLSTFYFNPDLPRQAAVRIPAGGAPDLLEVWYGAGGALTKLRVWTTATSGRELAAAAAVLRRRLGIEEP